MTIWFLIISPYTQWSLVITESLKQNYNRINTLFVLNPYCVEEKIHPQNIFVFFQIRFFYQFNECTNTTTIKQPDGFNVVVDGGQHGHSAAMQHHTQQAAAR